MIMATELYMGISNTARKISNMYIGVNGVARKVTKGYIGVNGKARLFYDSSGERNLVKVEWKNTTNPSSSERGGLIYTNNKFVSIPYNGTDIITSTDGINWSKNSSSMPKSGYVKITYGNGLYIASSVFNTTYCYSSDCINWTYKSCTGYSGGYGGIAFGNGKFVSVYNKNIYYYNGSDDFIKSFTATDQLSGIAFGNGKFVVMANDKVYHSTNGTSWSTSSLPISNSGGWEIDYFDDKFVIISQSNSKCYYSINGINSWNSVDIPLYISSYPLITHGDGKIMIVSDNNSICSNDLINWTSSKIPNSSGQGWSSIAYGNGKFVVTSEAHNLIAYTAV